MPQLLDLAIAMASADVGLFDPNTPFALLEDLFDARAGVSSAIGGCSRWSSSAATR